MVSEMAYESIVPNPVKSIPNVDVTMQNMEVKALPQFAGVTVNPDNYVAQMYVYEKENQPKIKKETLRKKTKKSKPKIKGMKINAKIKPLVPRQANPNMEFILGKQKKSDNTSVMGIDLGKIGDAFKKRKIKV